MRVTPAASYLFEASTYKRIKSENETVANHHAATPVASGTRNVVNQVVHPTRIAAKPGERHPTMTHLSEVRRPPFPCNDASHDTIRNLI